MKFILLFFIVLVTSAQPVWAHWGHLGELAGHGHLLGVGALILAGGLTGILLGAGKGDRADETQEDVSAEDLEGTVEESARASKVDVRKGIS